VSSNDLPPENTVVLEADIRRAPDRKPRNVKKNETEPPERLRVSNRIRERIYGRCGESDMKAGTKLVDPALKLYVGAHCMITDNDNVKEGRANGSMCQVRCIYKKDPTAPLSWKNYENKKVYTIPIPEVKGVEFEHFPPTFAQRKLKSEISRITLELSNYETETGNKIELELKLKKTENELEEISKKRRFILKPKKYTCIFNKDLILDDDIGYRRKLFRRIRLKKRNCKVQIIQLPVNLNDATTGHKLQGMTKKQLIIKSWSYSPGWVYTTISRVRTRDGLFLMEALDLGTPENRKCVSLNQQLRYFEQRLKEKIPEELRMQG
jgi:hypothetical protein